MIVGKTTIDGRTSAAGMQAVDRVRWIFNLIQEEQIGKSAQIFVDGCKAEALPAQKRALDLSVKIGMACEAGLMIL